MPEATAATSSRAPLVFGATTVKYSVSPIVDRLSPDRVAAWLAFSCDVTSIAEACSALTEYGVQNKIHVICENHGGPSSNPDALLALMKAVNGSKTVATGANFGTLPDFGNFPQEGGKYKIDVYDAIARMMPYAHGVSAKSYDFDDKGRESKLDFARIMKIVTDSGYDGWVMWNPGSIYNAFLPALAKEFASEKGVN